MNNTDIKLFLKTYKRNLVPVISLPKSASQTFFERLKHLYSANSLFIEPKIYAGMGHDFPIERKIKFSLAKTHFYYGHSSASGYLFNFFKFYNKFDHALLLVRPLKSCFQSYINHIEKYKYGPLDNRILDMPLFMDDWHASSYNLKMNYVLNFVLPLYIKLIKSWIAAQKAYKFNLRIISYNEIIEDGENLFDEIEGLYPFLKKSDSMENLALIKKNISTNYHQIKDFNQKQLDLIEAMLKFIDLDSNIKDYLLS